MDEREAEYFEHVGPHPVEILFKKVIISTRNQCFFVLDDAGNRFD